MQTSTNEKIKVTISLLAICIFLFSASVQAAVSENAMALSQAMISKPQYETLADAIVQAGISAAHVKVKSEKLKIDIDVKAAQLETALREAFSYDRLITLNAAQFERDYTQDELAEILAFYKSATGKRWTTKSSDYISKTLEIVHDQLQKAVPDMLSKLVAK